MAPRNSDDRQGRLRNGSARGTAIPRKIRATSGSRTSATPSGEMTLNMKKMLGRASQPQHHSTLAKYRYPVRKSFRTPVTEITGEATQPQQQSRLSQFRYPKRKEGIHRRMADRKLPQRDKENLASRKGDKEKASKILEYVTSYS